MLKKTDIKRIILIGLAIAGIVTMGYLVSLHFSESENSFCDINDKISCSAVNQSIYSEILGIPMSILGLFYFIGVLYVASLRYKNQTLKLLLWATIVFLGPSFYLTWVELFILNSICIFCEVSKAIMIAIVGLIIYELKPKLPASNFFVSAVIIGLLSAGATFFIHSRVIPPGTYSEFAQCLNDENIIMYGSASCGSCLKQRGMFGDAFEYITEIECRPSDAKTEEEKAEVERCATKSIEHTPTWIIEDGNGNTVQELESGIQSLETLSEVSGCPLPE